jgi:signal transduction histidine kinase
LLRVLQNLLTNAISYSPPGETIEVGYRRITPHEIEFFVKDNGPGVPYEYREAIFDKYFQLEKQADGRIYTVGLGLTFCKMAVEAHRGRIRLDSENSKGSRFSFILPLDRKRGRRVVSQ